MIEKVGEFSKEVISVLGLDIEEGTDIYIGSSNIAHIAINHNFEYNRFFDKIPIFILTADYVRLKADDGSIEYVKSLGKYIKLAVRVAGDGKFYVRSLYFIENDRVENLIKKGELKPLTKK